jgi:hypothetical protein
LRPLLETAFQGLAQCSLSFASEYRDSSGIDWKFGAAAAEVDRLVVDVGAQTRD